MISKTLIITGIGLAGLISATTVQARDNFSLSIGINTPAEYYAGHGAPWVHYGPRHYTPAPVVIYRPSPVYIAPAPVFHYGRGHHEWRRDRHDWNRHGRHHGWHNRHGHGHHRD